MRLNRGRGRAHRNTNDPANDICACASASFLKKTCRSHTNELPLVRRYFISTHIYFFDSSVDIFEFFEFFFFVVGTVFIHHPGIEGTWNWSNVYGFGGV